MASRKRPPLVWDGKKDLKYKWLLFANGKPISNVIAYNVKEGWYQIKSGYGIYAKILVKRIS